MVKNPKLTTEGTFFNDKKHGISKLLFIWQKALFSPAVVTERSPEWHYQETAEYKNGLKFGKETRDAGQ